MQTVNEFIACKAFIVTHTRTPYTHIDTHTTVNR